MKTKAKRAKVATSIVGVTAEAHDRALFFRQLMASGTVEYGGETFEIELSSLLSGADIAVQVREMGGSSWRTYVMSADALMRGALTQYLFDTNRGEVVG